MVTDSRWLYVVMSAVFLASCGSSSDGAVEQVLSATSTTAAVPVTNSPPNDTEVDTTAASTSTTTWTTTSTVPPLSLVEISAALRAPISAFMVSAPLDRDPEIVASAIDSVIDRVPKAPLSNIDPQNPQTSRTSNLKEILTGAIKSARQNLIDPRQSLYLYLFTLLRMEPTLGPAIISPAGTWPIGDQQGAIPAGRYQAWNVTNCYWERTDVNGRTIENDFIVSALRAEVVIQPTDYGFTFDNCGPGWVRLEP